MRHRHGSQDQGAQGYGPGGYLLDQEGIVFCFHPGSVRPAKPFMEIAEPGRAEEGQRLPAADPGVPEAEEHRGQLGRVVQVKVGERHDIRLGQGDPENGKLLECPQAGVDEERAAAVADHVPRGSSAGMGHGGP